MRGDNTECFKFIHDYLDNASRDKKKCTFDFDGWTDLTPKDIPWQMNKFDCGVFACMYAEHKSRDVDFNFNQANRILGSACCMRLREESYCKYVY